MKKKVTLFQSLLQLNAPKNGPHNHDNIVPFEEKERPLQDKKSGLCAYSLFSAFTADIIKENKLFTR
jgi:hypothetical protein